MATFTAPKGTAVAGTAIIASEHNENWTYVKEWLNGVPGDTGNRPGVLQSTGGSVAGTVTATAFVGPLTGDVTGNVSGTAATAATVTGAAQAAITSVGTLTSVTVTGTVSLGTSDAFYLDSAQANVVGLNTGTSITGSTASNFLYDSGVPVGTNTNEPYNSNHYRYSKYDTESGGGGAGGDRAKSQYRLVIDGSIVVKGDIIGYTDAWTGNSATYTAGDGTRIECQWLNVRQNVDIAGALRVNTEVDYARIYMGNDYTSNEDWIEWNDVITIDGTNIGPGFRFVHNDTAHLAIAQSAGVLSLHAEQGWPSLSGTAAVITTTGLNQLGISSSSIRFKEDVEDVETDDMWTKLRALKPRTFRWNEEVATNSGLDYETQTPELGFIAEEVHEAAPDATLYDSEGDPIVYREKSMLAMLVKAVQDIDNRLGALE